MRKRIILRRALLTLLLMLLIAGVVRVALFRLAQKDETEPFTPSAWMNAAPASPPQQEAEPDPLPVSAPSERPALTMPEPSELPCSRGEESLALPLGPLAISEVCLSQGDSVELRNISDEPVRLSEYYLSDKNKDRKKLQLPDQLLEPGAYFVSEGLSLSVKGERLWLSDGQERLLDYANISGLSAGGSYGRMDGEEGWFFFAVPSPGEENRDGFRRVAAKPQASLPGGVYEDVDAVTVRLSGAGVIHYTTDCSAPTAASPVYTEAITLEKTGILRAICVEEGALPSPVATFQYFLNEHHTLPILSFCSDDLGAWNAFYWGESRFGEYPGVVALYEDGEKVFQLSCGLRLKGFSAVLDTMKKNVGFYFRGRYGDGALEDCDLFGNGVSVYQSLIARAGQDHRGAIIRNELMQELCLQASEHVPTQHNRFCVLYMNGQYRGIYSLKENMNEHFLADIYGVSPESFVNIRQQQAVKECQSLQDLVRYCTENDMADPACYERFCQQFDIDNFVDFILLEGFSGNTDLYQNVRFFKSDELDGRWRFAFFDLDKCFYNTEAGMRVIFDNYAKPNHYVTRMSKSLIRNPDFRDKLLRRYAQWIDGPLSPENMLREIDLLEAQILPEVVRDRAHCGIGMSYWESRMQELRSFASEEYLSATIDVLCRDLGVTAEERSEYFGAR